MKKGLVVITGASSGIGEATAVRFSSAGYPLLLLSRRNDRQKALNLPNTICEQVDVTDLNSFKKAIEDAEKKFGPTECLINNAGVLFLGVFREQCPTEWKKMLDVNVMGLMNGIHIVLQGMVERKSGTIINNSSVAGRKNYPHHAGYCATKFAVHALTEGIREEVAPHNVRLITIAPGIVESEILDQTTHKEIVGNYKANKKRIGETLVSDDIARLMIFAYEQPQHMCIREIVVAPTKQEG